VTSDYLALFITDINRSFEGLVVSLDQDPPAMQQGALHARDLADALGSVGLAQISALTSDISGQLGLENPSILPVAKGFVELLKKALLALESGNPNAPLPEQIAIIGEITVAMSELMSPRVEHVQPKGLLEPQNDASAVPSIQQSAPEVLAPVVHLTQSADLQILFPLRRNGLNIVQRVREMVNHSGVGNSTEMDFLLAEHQDALTGLGQLELKTVLQAHADYVEADGVYADQDVAEALSLALALLPSGFSVHASKQALSLFIDIRGIHIDGAQMEAFGAAIQNIMGRVDQTSAYLRVVLPSSLKRIRMLPFKRADVLYAISWVQLCSISGLDSPMGTADLLGGVADAQKRMHLCSGVDLHTIYASEIFPVMNMNTFLLPGLLSGPPWMKGVALDGASRPYTWVYL
jgi:hypothetical protein